MLFHGLSCIFLILSRSSLALYFLWPRERKPRPPKHFCFDLLYLSSSSVRKKGNQSELKRRNWAHLAETEPIRRILSSSSGKTFAVWARFKKMIRWKWSPNGLELMRRMSSSGGRVSSYGAFCCKTHTAINVFHLVPELVRRKIDLKPLGLSSIRRMGSFETHGVYPARAFVIAKY